MKKIKSKRNGLLVDALPYTDVVVKLGRGAFAEYVSANGDAPPAPPEAETVAPPAETTAKTPAAENSKRKKAEKKEDAPPENDAAVETL